MRSSNGLLATAVEPNVFQSCVLERRVHGAMPEGRSSTSLHVVPRPSQNECYGLGRPHEEQPNQAASAPANVPKSFHVQGRKLQNIHIGRTLPARALCTTRLPTIKLHIARLICGRLPATDTQPLELRTLRNTRGNRTLVKGVVADNILERLPCSARARANGLNKYR